jgi:hypothetical protein
MAKTANTETTHPVAPSLPPPVDGGTDHIESLGGWVDRVLGDRRIRRRVHSDHIGFVMRTEDAPDDPEPAHAPEPVPDGTEIITKGEGPPGEQR